MSKNKLELIILNQKLIQGPKLSAGFRSFPSYIIKKGIGSQRHDSDRPKRTRKPAPQGWRASARVLMKVFPASMVCEGA